MSATLSDIGITLAAMALVTAIAAAAGATNFGTALGFGVVAFALALVWVLLKRD